jgi:N-acetyl-gamma-glutamylphosphate reductase
MGADTTDFGIPRSVEEKITAERSMELKIDVSSFTSAILNLTLSPLTAEKTMKISNNRLIINLSGSSGASRAGIMSINLSVLCIDKA